MTEILLNGISLDQLETSIKAIVSAELDNAVSKLSENRDTIPQLLTRKATADLLGVTLPTLHVWTKKGLIPAKKIGSRVRYDKLDVANALKSIEPLKYRRA